MKNWKERLLSVPGRDEYGLAFKARIPIPVNSIDNLWEMINLKVAKYGFTVSAVIYVEICKFNNLLVDYRSIKWTGVVMINDYNTDCWSTHWDAIDLAHTEKILEILELQKQIWLRIQQLANVDVYVEYMNNLIQMLWNGICVAFIFSLLVTTRLYLWSRLYLFFELHETFTQWSKQCQVWGQQV